MAEMLCSLPILHVQLLSNEPRTAPKNQNYDI